MRTIQTGNMEAAAVGAAGAGAAAGWFIQI